jgi:signal transduction histidine kinase
MDSSEAMQKLDLDSLLDSVCADAADAGHAVAFTGKTGISVAARPIALRRCLNNLIDNAIKYGQQVQVTAHAAAETVSIHIRDSGPGIPDSEHERVFDPFYRIENSRSRQTGGSGLGLTIARNIVEQHGGSIALRNLPEGGLEATLTLPRMPRL